jgi:hypothetical protein
MSDCLQGGRCGIYGANSPEWVISMQVRLLYQSEFYDELPILSPLAALFITDLPDV